MEPARAVRIALAARLDLRNRTMAVKDAQRKVVIAADDLRAGLDVVASGQAGERRSSVGSADRDDARLDFGEGSYALGLDLDLPWEKTAERNAYRNALIDLRERVRAAQSTEDEIKLQIRSALRELTQARESVVIQSEAVALAESRVRNTDLQLQAGRAEIRDVLFAQESLLSARNALTSALRGYRVAELALQRDMGVLEVNTEGLWKEYDIDAEE